ncbi:MAG: SAM-dependent methyltransferase [Jiangellaceae bacterium]
MELTDWNFWHAPYDDPGSSLSRRLRIIQQHLRTWLDDSSPRDVQVLSLCAGDARDLIDVLKERDDAARVSGVLVELDSRSCARAAAALAEAALHSVVVREGDAADSSLVADSVPADLVLLAGVFGNVSDDDVRRTIEALPMMCKPDAAVIWTRHRNAPDLTPAVRHFLLEAGFEEKDFTAPADAVFSVGLHRYHGRTQPWAPPGALFTFIR